MTSVQTTANTGPVRTVSAAEEGKCVTRQGSKAFLGDNKDHAVCGCHMYFCFQVPEHLVQTTLGMRAEF